MISDKNLPENEMRSVWMSTNRVTRMPVKEIEKKTLLVNNDTYLLKMEDESGNRIKTSNFLVLESKIKPLIILSSPIPETATLGLLMKHLDVKNTGEIVGKEIYLYPDDRNYLLPVTFNPNFLEAPVYKCSQRFPDIFDIPLGTQKGKYGTIRNIDIVEVKSINGTISKRFQLKIEDSLGRIFNSTDAWIAKKSTRLLTNSESTTTPNLYLSQLLEQYKIQNISELLGKEVDLFKYYKNNWALLTFDPKLLE